MTEPVIVLALEALGDRLAISARRRAIAGQDEDWYDLEIEAVAHPFRGTISELVMASDLARFRDSAAQLTVPGAVVLGGDRAAELRLGVEPQVGGEAGRWVVEVTLTPHGDDPYPLIQWLLFDQRPFAEDLVAAIDALIGAP